MPGLLEKYANLAGERVAVLGLRSNQAPITSGTRVLLASPLTSKNVVRTSSATNLSTTTVHTYSPVEYVDSAADALDECWNADDHRLRQFAAFDDEFDWHPSKRVNFRLATAVTHPLGARRSAHRAPEGSAAHSISDPNTFALDISRLYTRYIV